MPRWSTRDGVLALLRRRSVAGKCDRVSGSMSSFGFMRLVCDPSLCMHVSGRNLRCVWLADDRAERSGCCRCRQASATVAELGGELGVRCHVS